MFGSIDERLDWTPKKGRVQRGQEKKEEMNKKESKKKNEKKKKVEKLIEGVVDLT